MDVSRDGNWKLKQIHRILAFSHCHRHVSSKLFIQTYEVPRWITEYNTSPPVHLYGRVSLGNVIRGRVAETIPPASAVKTVPEDPGKESLRMRVWKYLLSCKSHEVLHTTQCARWLAWASTVHPLAVVSA